MNRTSRGCTPSQRKGLAKASNGVVIFLVARAHLTMCGLRVPRDYSRRNRQRDTPSPRQTILLSRISVRDAFFIGPYATSRRASWAGSS